MYYLECPICGGRLYEHQGDGVYCDTCDYDTAKEDDDE